jgi:hypothetical protein
MRDPASPSSLPPDELPARHVEEHGTLPALELQRAQAELALVRAQTEREIADRRLTDTQRGELHLTIVTRATRFAAVSAALVIALVEHLSR